MVGFHGLYRFRRNGVWELLGINELAGSWWLSFPGAISGRDRYQFPELGLGGVGPLGWEGGPEAERSPCPGSGPCLACKALAPCPVAEASPTPGRGQVTALSLRQFY